MSGEAKETVVIGSLADLPERAEGSRHLVWWGNLGFMAIEGMGFALAAVAYLYLMSRGDEWPPPGDSLPSLGWSGVFTAALLLSEVPIPGLSGTFGRVGPSLDGFASRTEVAGVLANDPAELVVWLREPQTVKPGNGMPNQGIGEIEARDIAAYLLTLN